MKYFFILGRNPLLSKAEIVSYLESRRSSWTEVFFKRNLLVIDCDAEFAVQDFGGIVKLGKIEFEGGADDFKSFLDKNDLVDKNKFSYCVIGNLKDDIFQEKFKSQKQKAIIRRGRKSLKLQEGDSVLVPNAEFEFFAYEFENNIYFGKVIEDYSFMEVKKRDMKKPIRRESLAISPRLGKIMVNLSQIQKGGLLLDGFCGVGGILIEALIKEINVYGIDKDPRAINQCRQNLKWLEKNYKINGTWKLLNEDARSAPNIKFDAVVSEPALGELQKSKPNDKKAETILKNFEKLIIPVLQRLVKLKKQGAKIVLTSPYIRNFSVNWEIICKKTKLQVHQIKGLEMKIKEKREGQFIGREIVVLI